MTWAEFKTKVRENLLQDSVRLNIQTYVDNLIRAGVIDIQSDIDLYRKGQETIYGVDDVVEDGEASLGVMPDQAQIQDAYMVSTGYQCARQPMYLYDWGNRFDMKCGNMGACQFAISIDPQSKNFYAYPKLTDGSQVSMFWDGLKLEFSDSDTVPFDEQMAMCVAEWVTGHVERRVNKDREFYLSYLAPRSGSYYVKKAKLYLDARQRRSIKQTSDSPQQNGDNCIPESDNDDTIEFMAFGDFGKDGANELAVSRLVKAFEPDFLLWLGDANYDDGAASTIRENILKYYDGYVPDRAYPCWGDADLGTTENSQYGNPLLDIFPDIAALNSSKLYYDFVRGNAHFFVVNSGYSNADPREPDLITSGGTQGLWIKAAIEASSAPWKIVVLHRPPYSSSTTNPGNSTLRWAFQTWGAHLVLSGHARTYERILVDGLTYIVAGTGGHTLDTFTNIQTGSQKRYVAKHGALRISVNATRLQSVFYSVDNEIIDNLTMYK